MTRLYGSTRTALLMAAPLLALGHPALAQSALADSAPSPAPEQTDQARQIAELQRQIDELKAMVGALQTQQAATPAPALAPAPTPAPGPGAPVAAVTGTPPAPAADPRLAAAAQPAKPKAWYERLRLRGYTQMRFNQIVSGPADAPAGISRLRTIGDGDVRGDSNFSFRRIRMIIQGDVNEHLSLYFQPDFAAAVSNQSVGERREGSVSLRDMYADVFPFEDKSFRIRLGQSKVPYGWENMQSSSNRLALDRTDAINTAAAGERDLGIVAYYTPPKVQAIWDRLTKDGQKLFGNYGAFGFGAFNGQGLNRTEGNDGVMLVGLATWPFELDGLGLDGQVFEIGGSVMHNRIRPEIRSGGLSPATPPGWRLCPADGQDRPFADRPVLSLRALAVLPRRLQGGDQCAPAGDRGAGTGLRIPARSGARNHHHLWLGLTQGGRRAPLRAGRGADPAGAGPVELLIGHAPSSI